MLSALIPTVPTVTVEETVRMVQEQVVIRPQATRTTTHVAIAAEDWGWDQLRDYVVTEIEKVRGVFPRNTITEKSIFVGFLNRWGADAPRIARYAFEVAGGYWRNAPISVNRFCKNSDEYFAKPIAEHLRQADAARAAMA